MAGKIGSELEAGVGEVCEQWWEEENAYRDLRVRQGEICLLEFWNQFRNRDHKHTDGRKSTLTGRFFTAVSSIYLPHYASESDTHMPHTVSTCAHAHTHTHTHTHTLQCYCKPDSWKCLSWGGILDKLNSLAIGHMSTQNCLSLLKKWVHRWDDAKFPF